jgi:sodium/potassium-transporting ATPase subunit beta
MGNKLSGFGRALYNPKRRQFLGRDGAGWGKLGVFYFFFYIGLAGFFCAMLAIFMALTPRDIPRFYSDTSCMKTRSNPLSPGLGFRPQPEVDKNLILIDRDASPNDENPYVKNLDQYLRVYYSQKTENRQDNEDNEESKPKYDGFVIKRPGECTNTSSYGFATGRPCVLVKMNKVVGFEPKPGSTPHERAAYAAHCNHNPDAIAVHCYGEYPADVDNIGNITYYSENGPDDKCGSLETKWFPYPGKYERKDIYQAPYVWVQFTKPKKNVLINVLCRIYGQNIDFEKKAGRALTRFQLYVQDKPGGNL